MYPQKGVDALQHTYRLRCLLAVFVLAENATAVAIYHDSHADSLGRSAVHSMYRSRCGYTFLLSSSVLSTPLPLPSTMSWSLLVRRCVASLDSFMYSFLIMFSLRSGQGVDMYRSTQHKPMKPTTREATGGCKGLGVVECSEAAAAAAAGGLSAAGTLPQVRANTTSTTGLSTTGRRVRAYTTRTQFRLPCFVLPHAVKNENRLAQLVNRNESRD